MGDLTSSWSKKVGKKTKIGRSNMSFVINTNVGAVVTSKNLVSNQREMDRVAERLSSGKKTIYASDDAAGVAIAGKMEAQIRGLSAGTKHAKDGKSLAASAEASMQVISKVLQRMRELAIQAGSGTASNSDKDYMNLEMSNLVAQVEGISENSKFNGRQLLRGEQFSFYTDHDIGGMKITTAEADMAVTSLGVPSTTVSIGGGVPQSNLSNIIQAIDTALETVSTKRAHLGAISNRFDHIMNNLQSVISNTERSRSVMIDADFSIESTKFTRNTILQQGSTSMLAQANAKNSLVLALFNQKTY